MNKIVTKVFCWNILAFPLVHGFSNCGVHSMSSMPLYVSVSRIRNLTPTTVRTLLCWRHMQQIALEYTHKMYIQKHILETTLITQMNL
jgi:hypothetical protein